MQPVNNQLKLVSTLATVMLKAKNKFIINWLASWACSQPGQLLHYLATANTKPTLQLILWVIQGHIPVLEQIAGVTGLFCVILRAARKT